MTTTPKITLLAKSVALPTSCADLKVIPIANLVLIGGMWLLAARGHAATVTWVGADGDWSTPANWSSGLLPGTNDDVVIDQPGLLNITHTNGTHRVRSLRCQETLRLTGGTLGVNSGQSQLNGDLQMSLGATLEAVGAGTVLSALNATNIDGGSLTVSGGATLSLPSVHSYHKGSGCGAAANWQITGTNSILDLSGLVALTGGDCSSSAGLSISSQSGGQAALGNLLVIQDSYVSVLSEGTNSTVDLSALADYQAARFTLSLTARVGGSILVPQLVNGHGVLLTVQSGGHISTAQFRQLSGISADQASVVSLPAVTNIDGANLSVSLGAQLSLPSVRSYHASGSSCPQVIWRAGNPGSVLDLSGLTEVNTTGCGNSPTLYIQALAGGSVLLNNLVTLADGTVAVAAEGLASLPDGSTVVDLSGLTAYNGPTHQFSLDARIKGRILIPNLITVTNGGFYLSTPGGFLTDQLRFLAQTTVTLDGVTNSFDGLLDTTTSTTFSLLNHARILPHAGTQQPIVLNQLAHARLSTPFSVDSWDFTGVANQQVSFHLVNVSHPGPTYAQTGPLFTLTGPGGWTGFSNLTNNSAPVTLPSSGAYSLTTTGVGYRPDYAMGIFEDSPVTLDVGALFQGYFWGSGQAQIFRINVTNGGPMRITLGNTGAGNRIELYVSQGVPPTRANYDYRSSGTGSGAQLGLPIATVGSWYVLVYADTVSTPGDFTLQTTSASVLLNTVNPPHQGRNADLTLTLDGGGFTPATTVALLDINGTAYPAASAAADSTTRMIANFPSNTLPVGTYSVRVIKEDGASAVLTNAFEADPAGEPQLAVNLVNPPALGRHVPATLYVEYSNTGHVAMAAPLLTLHASARALLTLDPSITARGLWAGAQPAGFNDTVQFLASGGTPGTLQAGETGRMAVYYGGLALPWDPALTEIDFNLTVLQAYDGSLIDWTPFEQSLRPPSISPEAWAPIWQNFRARVGATASQYFSVLMEDESYLGRVGVTEPDVTELLAFELQRAAGLRLSESLEDTTDSNVDAPGLRLVVGRSFGMDIVQRYQAGALGRGWAHTWERSILQETNGNIRVLGPNVSVRLFQPDQRTVGGPYFTERGDHGVLNRLQDGTFSLRELSGETTHFRADGKLDWVQDLNTNRITAVYSADQLTRLNHSSGQSIQLTYNAAGRISQVADSQGRTNTYAYDVSGDHLLSVTAPEGTTTYTYVLGNGAASEHALASVAYPGGTHRFFTYEAHGWLSGWSRDGGAEPVTIGYGTAGTVTLTDGLSHTTQVFIDHRGLPVKTIDALGQATALAFDANFNLTRATDAIGQSSSFSYDVRGNLITAKDRLGSSTHFTFTVPPLDRLLSLTDARGNVTTNAYDTRGNQTSETNAAGRAALFTYDSRGNVNKFTNRRNDPTQYTRDAAGRITRKSFSSGAHMDYAYDTRDNLILASNNLGSITMAYDLANRMTNIAYPGGHSLRFTYDAAGRRTRRVDETGYAVNYTYDTVGRLAQLIDAGGNPLAAYSYDSAGRMSRKTLGNGVFTDYAYDANGQILSVTNRKPDNSLLSSYLYTYDLLERPVTMTITRGYNLGLPAAETQSFTYDASGQLTTVAYSNGRSVTYAYDAAGNRVQVSDNGVTTDYAANALNQYTSVGGTTYRYDADGNETNRSSTGVTNSYTFDAENRLVGQTTPTDIWAYSYDALGNRTVVTHNGQTTRYLLDPAGLGDVIAEYDAGGQLVARYEHGFGLVARTAAAGDRDFYTFSAQGHTSELTDSGGVPLNGYDYDPFANSLGKSETVPNPFQYVGEYGVMAEGSGMLFIRARYYDSTTGRFLSADPAGIQAEDVNLYRYALNRPTALSDPSGWQPVLRIHEVTTSDGPHYNEVYVVYPDGTVVRLPEYDPLSNPNASPPLGGGSGGGTGSSGAGGGGAGAGSTSYPDDDDLAPLPHRKPSAGAGSKHPKPKAGKPHGGGGKGGAGSNTKKGGPAGKKPVGGSQIPPVTSHDPNGKAGPGGFGPSGFVPGDQLFAYRIDFENEAQAVPAQQVTISDLLITNLDWNTFRLSEVGFGDVMIPVPDDVRHFETDVPMTFNGTDFTVHVEAGIRYASGEVYAAFYSLDPNTSLPPSVDVGFLPAEDGTGRGQGHISYIAKAAAGLPTGTEIRNVARISFDNQPDIATNQRDPHNPGAGTDPAKEAPNTIDSGPPASHVASLPTESGRAIQLQWSGQDDLNGSGIASYDIYVAINGGDFTPWLQGTNATSATFHGENAATYAFYSLARDQVGNQESPHLTADAVTTVAADAPILDPVTNRVVGVGLGLVITNVVEGTPPRGAFVFSLGPGAPVGATLNPSTGVFGWTPACTQGGTTNEITISVTDSGRPNLVDSVTFTVVVQDCLAAQLGRLVLREGDIDRLPVYLFTSVPLTNLTALVSAPTNWLTPAGLEAATPEICLAGLTASSPPGESLPGWGYYAITFATCTNQILPGSHQIAWLDVDAATNQPSAFVPVAAGPTTGTEPDGSQLNSYLEQSARVVVVGQETLLEAVPAGIGYIQLIVYALPGTTNQIQTAETLAPQAVWVSGQQVISTNLSTPLIPLPATNRMLLFRTSRP